MIPKFVIHAHAENPDQDALLQVWKMRAGTELRLYLSVIDMPDAKPRWAIARVHKVEHWDNGVHALACTALFWADSKDPLGAAVFLYRTKETEGVGMQKSQIGHTP